MATKNDIESVIKNHASCSIDANNKHSCKNMHPRSTSVILLTFTNDAQHTKRALIQFAGNTGPDQPAHVFFCYFPPK